MFMLNVIISAVGCLGLYFILIKLLGNNVTLMKAVGVAVCDLTQEERVELAEYIDDILEEAKSNGIRSVILSYEELCLDMFTEGVEDEMQEIVNICKSCISSVYMDVECVKFELDVLIEDVIFCEERA